MKTRRCTICGRRKPASAFYGHRHSYCRPCDQARYRKLAAQSRRWIEDYARRWRRKAGAVVGAVIAAARRGAAAEGDGPPHAYYRAQHQAIVAYGGYRCACCGESEPLFLTLDHMNNGGNRHRKRLGSSASMRLYQWLRDNRYPPGYRVLCVNCNLGRHRNGGVCPHKKKRKRGSAPSR